MAQAIQLPDGTYFPVKQGERPDDAYRAAMQLYPSAFAPQQPEPPKPEAEGGFFPALKAGYSALKSDVAGLAGRSGLMDLAEAEKYIAGEKKYQAETFKPTTESFAEAPLTNIKELLGGSLPYMAAPLVAGAAASSAPVAGALGLAGAGATALGLGGAGLASLAQFTGSNLSRQVEDGGKTLGETDITNAALAAIPQTALDIISLRMIPGLGKILEGAGVKLAKEEVKNFAEEALKKTATDYALKTGRTMGVEGLTEASQQIFERAQAGLNITDPEARQEYFDSFIGGAVLGGVIAPAGRYIERGQAQTRYDIGEAVKQQTAQQEQLKLDAIAAAEEERKKSSPEYFQTLSTEYKAAEQAKNDLKAQLRKVVAGSETETADRLHNTEITAQIKEMSPGVQALAAEYNRLQKVQPKADETAPEKEQVSLAVGDTLDNPLGNFTKEELASRAPTVAKYIDAERKKAGKPALETYSIEDIRNAMPNQLPEAEQADLSSLIAAKSGHTGDITYKPTDVIEVAKQKNIDTTTDGFKDFLRRATGDAELEQLTQPQLHSAFKALSSLPRFDEPQILPTKRNATDYSKEQYGKAVAGLQKLVEDRKLGGTEVVKEGEKPIAKPVSIAEAYAVIKAQTGLKNDADVQTLFRDANRNGDIDFKGDEVTYQPRGAQAEFNIEEGFAPAEGTGFNVMRNGEMLFATNDEAEANAKAEKLGKNAAPAIQQIDKSIAKENSTVADSQKALDAMEAEGKFNTPQYTQAAARHAGVVDKANKTIESLNAKKQMLQKPVTVQKAGKPTNRKTFTVKEKGVEEKAFNTREEAEKHALENLPEERLNELSTQTKAPGFANRLKKEQERRKKPVLALPAPKPKGPSAEATALHAKLLPMLRKFGLGDVALKIEEAMVDEGSYGANVITVALDADNPIRVLRHETIHGLKDLGFFTPGQWKILENQADKVWIDKYLKQRNRGGGPLKAGEQSRYEAYEELYNKDMDKIREEAISDAFADFDVNGAPKGLFAQLLNAMRKFFRNLRAALNGAGYETAEDIFGKVERGELKATKAADGEEAKPSLRTAEEGVPFSTRAIMEQNTAFAQNELGLETVKKKGAANSNNVRDVAIALNNKTLQEHGRMDEKNHTPEDVQRIADAMADEVSYQLTTKSKTGTGTGWYSYNYPNAVKRLAARFPELAESQYARSVFSALVAVTSNGERVDKNIDNAIKLYADLRMGKPLVAMGNRRPTALEKNLVAIQDLMNDYGEANFENELRREITVKEMNAFLRSKGEKTNNDYLANSRVPAAAIYFGPKLGAFYANLSGSEGYLTMDLWWTRSINRMRGLLIPRATEASIGKFREMMGMPEATREEVVAASIPLRNKYKEYGYTTELEHLAKSKEPDTNAKKPEWFAKAKKVAGSAYPQLEFEHRLEKMANTIHKNEYEMLEEAPFGAGDRRFMYDAAKKAQSILAKDGIKLTLADIQAALWYYEKRLYAKLTGRIADDIGYEEAIIAKSREGTGRERPSVVFSGQPNGGNDGARAVEVSNQRGQGDDQKRASLRTAIQSYRGRNEESPDSHTRRGFRDGEGFRVLGRESIAAYAPTEDFKNTVGEFDHQSPTFYEMSPKDADVFKGAIEKSKSNSKYGAAVGVYSEDEYAKMRTFLTQDGKAGFALKGNDIVSVFSSPEHKGSASSSLQLAVQEGGRKLDAFDTILPPMYYDNGFKVTGRSRWNEEYIPDNWSKQTFQKFNNGEPDVVYMVYDPENDTPPSVKSPDQYFENYDDLIKAQDDAVEKYFNEGVGYGTKEQNQRAREFKAEAERLPQQGGVRRSVRLLDDKTRAKYPYVEEPVEGLPAKAKVDGVEVTFGPYAPAREAAILHAEQSGIPYRQQASYYKIDPAFSKKLASAFLQMKDNPSAPEVKAAYDAWADETIAQYKAMLKTGITIEFMPNNRDPYGNPRNAILDVINNNHLYVFPADGGFGSAAITEEQIRKNPALALTDIMISGRPARVVEVFRATHDFYGHVKEGFGFRAEGEENAFQSHVRMYSPLAARAMTAGTRGQNSVVNFGPYAEFNKTASGEETKYADQKIGLLPQWATDTNITPDVRASLRTAPNTVEFKQWFGDSKVVDKNGEPLVVYHGSLSKGVTEFDTTRISQRSAKGDIAGTYFTSDPQAAYNYTREFGASIKTPRGDVTQAYLKIENPLNTTAAIKKYRKQGMSFGDAKRKALEALTPEHDGVIFDGDAANRSEYVVFKPTQIKSATNNTGAFDETNPDIRYSLSQVREIFDRAENISEPPGVESIREQWIGGVSGIGDRSAMYDLYRVGGSKKYIQDVQDFIRKELGDDFKGYRLMSNDELEEIQTGSMGSQFASFTLNPDIARAFKNIPAYAKKTGMSVVEMDLTPEHVAMIGHPGELELVVDYGQGYNPDEVKVVERYSLRTAPQTAEFKRWFGDSKIVDANGNPRVMYHGTAQDITAFKPKQAGAIFLTDDPTFAGRFSGDSLEWMSAHADQFLTPAQLKEGRARAIVAIRKDYGKRPQGIEMIDSLKSGDYIDATPEAKEYLRKFYKEMLPSGPSIMPVYIRAEKPFDFDNREHVQAVLDEIRANDEQTADYAYGKTNAPRRRQFDYSSIETGRWEDIESAKVQDAIKSLGFDGFYVLETGRKNLAVYDPAQIKSATGNEGTYDINNPDIRKSLRSAAGMFDQDELNKNAVTRYKSREKVVEMDIDDFLNLADYTNSETDSLSREKMANARKRVADGTKFTTLPHMSIDGYSGTLKVTGHEGRHRAKALKEVGYKTMPVLLHSNIRWSEQNDPEKFDYEEGWPTRIEAQEGAINPNFSIPFPFTREESGMDYEQPTQARASLRTAPDTPEFKQWFKESKAVDENGKPILMYHGTNRDFNEPRTQSKGAFFVTPSLNFANKYAANDLSWFSGKKAKAGMDYVESGANVMPVWVSVQNPFDYNNKEHVNKIIPAFRKALKEEEGYGNKEIASTIQNLRQGNYRAISLANDYDVISKAGFDGFWEYEANVRNLGVFKPEQIKSAIGNTGAFDETNPDIRKSLRTNVKNDLSNMPNGAAILATMNRVTPPRETKGFAERVINALAPEASSYFRQNFLDRYNRLNDYDRMVAQQMGGVELLADQSSHWAALNSDMAAGVTASALGVGDRMGGAPVLKNGYVTVDNFNGTVKGVLEILSPLASRGDPDIYRAYQIWSAAKRGTRLYREGRFELLTPAEIKDALTLEQKYPEFVTVQQDWIKYNNALVKMQVDGGVITKEAGVEFMKYSDYIPLYRQMDGRTTLGPSVYQSISGVKPPKTLKGKGDAPIEDYLETIVRNTQAAIQSTMKNVAAQKAVKNGMMLGMVTKLPAVSSAPDTITILENGKKVSYQCADKLFIEAVSSLNLPELPFLSILSAPADLLRSLVTKDPGFMLANMMRDSLSAYVTSGANIKPVISTVQNVGAAMMNRSPIYQALLNSGAIGGYEYSRNVEAGADAFAADLRRKTGTETGSEKLFKPFTKVWGFLERGTEISDAATRMAVYEATLKETGNEAEAIRRAVEVLNFNRKGRSAIVRIAAAAIPFLNARVQGLDVFFRAGIRPFYDKNSTAYEKQVQKAMLIRGATMMALSTMYAAAIMGDPDYEKQEQETKDNNWLIPSLGIKLPIPFEVGVLFKTIPERIYRYSYGSDTSKDLGDAMKRALLSTFAFNPVPQAIAPLLEAQYNYSVFTQRPIVGEAMRNIAPEFQVGPSTTKIAEYLGKQTGMSPIMLDHVYKGYTGTMGMYLADVMDAVFSAGSDNPKASQRFEQTPVLKRFLLDPDARGQVSAYYDLKNSVDETVRTVNLLSKQGSPDLEGYIEKNISMYGMKGYVSSVDKQMQKLSAQAAMIRSTPMPADEKRKMLDEVTRLQNDLTNEIQLIRKMARP